MNRILGALASLLILAVLVWFVYGVFIRDPSEAVLGDAVPPAQDVVLSPTAVAPLRTTPSLLIYLTATPPAAPTAVSPAGVPLTPVGTTPTTSTPAAAGTPTP